MDHSRNKENKKNTPDLYFADPRSIISSRRRAAATARPFNSHHRPFHSCHSIPAAAPASAFSLSLGSPRCIHDAHKNSSAPRRNINTPIYISKNPSERAALGRKGHCCLGCAASKRRSAHGSGKDLAALDFAFGSACME